MLLRLLLSCADELESFEQTRALQRETIKCFLSPSPAGTPYRLACQLNHDICHINGFRCVDGLVREIVSGNPDMPSAGTIDLAWAPGTVEYIHLNFPSLRMGWSAALLPRQLKYMFMKNCKLAESARGPERKAQLECLPRQLEEFYLFNSALCGKLNLTTLPPNLRWFVLQQTVRISLFVDIIDLPRTLHGVLIHGEFYFSDKKKPMAAQSMKDRIAQFQPCPMDTAFVENSSETCWRLNAKSKGRYVLYNVSHEIPRYLR